MVGKLWPLARPFTNKSWYWPSGCLRLGSIGRYSCFLTFPLVAEFSTSPCTHVMFGWAYSWLWFPAVGAGCCGFNLCSGYTYGRGSQSSLSLGVTPLLWPLFSFRFFGVVGGGGGAKRFGLMCCTTAAVGVVAALLLASLIPVSSSPEPPTGLVDWGWFLSNVWVEIAQIFCGCFSESTASLANTSFKLVWLIQCGDVTPVYGNTSTAG